MDLNFIVYKSHESTYTKDQHQDHLIYVPKLSNQSGKRKDIEDCIPCMYFPSEYQKGEPDYLLLYFHGNQEDLGDQLAYFQQLKQSLKMSVMAVEYPGYGIYRGKDCSANKIKEDAITVFKYIMNSFKIKEKNVLVFGRSIGTGPACFLAESYQNIKALILQSPYTDISVVAEDNIGIKSNLLQVVMASHFQNIKTIKKIEAPILFIHGKKDLSIPFEHSEILYKKTQNVLCSLCLHDEMDHNPLTISTVKQFIIRPIKQFVSDIVQSKMLTEQSLKLIDDSIDGDWNQENLINSDEPQISRIEYVSKQDDDQEATQSDEREGGQFEQCRFNSFAELPMRPRCTIVRTNSSDMKFVQIQEERSAIKYNSPVQKDQLLDKNAILYFKNYVINGKYGQIQEEEVKFINDHYFD